jgi:hypothetical protein
MGGAESTRDARSELPDSRADNVSPAIKHSLLENVHGRRLEGPRPLATPSATAMLSVKHRHQLLLEHHPKVPGGHSTIMQSNVTALHRHVTQRDQLGLLPFPVTGYRVMGTTSVSRLHVLKA